MVLPSPASKVALTLVMSAKERRQGQSPRQIFFSQVHEVEVALLLISPCLKSGHVVCQLLAWGMQSPPGSRKQRRADCPDYSLVQQIVQIVALSIPEQAYGSEAPKSGAN